MIVLKSREGLYIIYYAVNHTSTLIDQVWMHVDRVCHTARWVKDCEVWVKKEGGMLGGVRVR